MFIFIIFICFFVFLQNGPSRSQCMVLECFGTLFPLTRPLRCSSYAQSFVPVLVELLNRMEESVHEALQDAFTKILPVLTPFMNIANLKVNPCAIIYWHTREAK